MACVSCRDDDVTSSTDGLSSTSAVSGATSSHASAASSSSGSGGAGGSSSSASTSTGEGGSGGAPTGTRVRIVAANLTSGDLQSYDPGQGKRILAGIQGDVVLLQEFNQGNNSAGALTDLVEEVCGMDCSYVRGPDAQIPNGIVSRFTVVASGSWVDALVDNRSFVWARLDVPGDADLWAVSVHLLTSSASERASEAATLLSHLDAVVSPGDRVVIGGDFNTTSRTEAALTTLDPMFSIAGPYPADQAGDETTNETRAHPYDWVLPNDALAAVSIPAVIGTSTFAHGAVIDTRVYQPLSDIAPAQMGDSGAPSMQHMAVVRDFSLE